jgi:type IV pilus assembly protein PilW
MALQRREAGLTLIELLVVLAISAFLLAGLFTIEQNMSLASKNQAALTQLQDNERLAMTRLAETIQHAGYYTAPILNTPGGALQAQTVGTTAFVAGQSIAGTHTSPTTGDSVSARFLTTSVDGLLNCDGTPNVSSPATVPNVNTFSIDANQNLVCTVTTGSGSTSSILVPGITNMQITYGVNTTTASNAPVDTYLTADKMTSAYWLNVLSVRINLTFTNPLASQPGQPATLQFARIIGIMNRAGVN